MRGRALLVVVALVAACGDNTDHPASPDAGADAGVDAPGDASVDPPVTGYCRAISEVICEGLSSCGCGFDTRPYDAATCVAVRTAECVDNTAAQAADVAAGRATVDPSSLARCVAALEEVATRCGEGELPEACRDTLLATATIGATCELSGGGLAFCAAGAGVCAPGTNECLPLPAQGEACLGEVLCGRDLVCAGGTCEPPGAANAPCVPGSCGDALVCGPELTCVAPGAIDAACVVDEHCAVGLRCEQGATGGTCQPASEAGAGCRGEGACGAGRSCVPAPETRTCTTPDGTGDGCETDSCGDELTCSASTMTCVGLPGANEPCLDNQCAEGLLCEDGTGVCIPAPGVGDPCAVGSRFCADGLGCEEATWTCQVPPGAGQSCLLNPPDYLCAPGFGCDFDAGTTCVARGAAGAPCTSDRTCVASTYCEVSTNTCTPRLAAGSSCEDGNECQAGHECAFVGGVAQCRPIPSAGEPCQFACADELACKGPGGACAPAFCAVR